MGNEEKSRLRREALALRAAISTQERERAAVLLAERIVGHQWFYRAEVLLGFASYGTEIRTYDILEEALKQGKKVFLPRVCGRESAKRKLIFYRIFSIGELEAGCRGIPEPKGDTEEYVYPEEHGQNAPNTLLLMPGVAFDPFGNRMGYGGGFYDRFLADKEALRLCSIAVGFRCQMMGQIPVQEHDVRPYQIICV